MKFIGSKTFIFFSLLILSSSALHANPDAVQSEKEQYAKQVQQRYEHAIALAEDLNIYEEDKLHITPRIGMVTQALLTESYGQADDLLGGIETDLIKEQSQKGRSFRNAKLEWLEIYVDLFQRFIIISILAFIAMRFGFIRRKMKKAETSPSDNFYLMIIIVAAAFALSLFDFRRYGNTSWIFVDYDVVLLACGSFIGAPWVGISAGFLIGLLRWFMKPDLLSSLGIGIGMGFYCGCFSSWIPRPISNRRVFLFGMLAGMLHATLIYSRMQPPLALMYFLFGVAFLAFAEACAITLYFVVSCAILEEENRREMKQELLKTQLLFLQAQINPHFLYNALNTLAAICDKGDMYQVKNLILKLSDMFRRSSRHASDLISLQDEMKHIDAYVELEQARFEERLRYVKNIEISENYLAMKIPTLMLQPIIENAIKHGIGKKKTGGTITLSLKEQNGCIQVDIEDDGVGEREDYFDKILKGEVKPSSHGIGITNIHERMTRLWGDAYGLRFHSQPGLGTHVTLRFPKSELLAA